MKSTPTRRGVLGLAAAAVLLAGCGSGGASNAAGTTSAAKGGKTVVAATAWEAAFAKAAGAGEVKVIVPASVAHAADYDPKASDLAAVAGADLVLYASFEGFAGKLKEAAGGKGQLVEVKLDNAPDSVRGEVRRLAGLLGTESAAQAWIGEFDKTVTGLGEQLRGAWKDGKAPKVVSQAFVAYAAQLAGAEVVGTFGPEPVTPGQLAALAGKRPDLVFDNAHMSTGTVLPGVAARQVKIVNYPGADLDLLGVFRTNAAEITKALRG